MNRRILAATQEYCQFILSSYIVKSLRGMGVAFDD